jgi:hypothetical protein
MYGHRTSTARNIVHIKQIEALFADFAQFTQTYVAFYKVMFVALFCWSAGIGGIVEAASVYCISADNTSMSLIRHSPNKFCSS